MRFRALIHKNSVPALLEQNVTAIICSHDLLAHTVMIHCQELGLRVPQDISIIGFDDLPLCAYTAPPMTTIQQNRTQIGKSAFYALSSLLAGVCISALLLHTQLIVRQSTGKASAQNTQSIHPIKSPTKESNL